MYWRSLGSPANPPTSPDGEEGYLPSFFTGDLRALLLTLQLLQLGRKGICLPCVLEISWLAGEEEYLPTLCTGDLRALLLTLQLLQLGEEGFLPTLCTGDLRALLLTLQLFQLGGHQELLLLHLALQLSTSLEIHIDLGIFYIN